MQAKRPTMEVLLYRYYYSPTVLTILDIGAAFGVFGSNNHVTRVVPEEGFTDYIHNTH